jgi:preprotein translocase subunit SecG
VILIQNKNVSLNLTSMWGWMGEVTRRWSDKVLHNTTVILGSFFIAISILLFVA